MALSFKSASAIAEKRGDQTVGNQFSGYIRDFDFNGLVVGDEFIVPESYEVRKQKMRGTDRDGNPIYAEYIFVETQNGVKQFFPGMFSKNVMVYEQTNQGEPLRSARNSDGTPVWKHVNGTATEEFRKALPDINEGMMNLAKACKAGKKVKISASTPVLTKAFGRDALTRSNIYTIDLV